MIEITVLNYLASVLPVAVVMEVPESPPERFVLLKKADGGKENHLPYAMFTAQSYGQTLLEAAELNEQVKTAMEKITELDEISGCYLNSDYNFTDTASKRYRYQAVFDIYHY